MEIQTIVRSFGIGAATGLRSMSGPAVTRWRAGDPIRLAFAALAAGELVADKLPATPARTVAPALAFRALTGAFAAASAIEGSRNERIAAALAGTLGAVSAAYVGMWLRAAIVRGLHLPDALVALGEDALAVGAAVALTRA